jgi:hypothetical protein
MNSADDFDRYKSGGTMLKKMKGKGSKRIKQNENEYFIINIDEPYAEDIFEILKRGQMAKGEWPEGDISFEEWQEETFGQIREQRMSDMMNYRDGMS